MSEEEVVKKKRGRKPKIKTEIPEELEKLNNDDKTNDMEPPKKKKREEKKNRCFT